ncbi:MAG: sigma-54-dependent Fis family transcriptional regulator [Ignavibacteriae bacterium]|nr:sigma-54-dependent Fis family transcriptional regulator [Ignavibacteriota bacterium]
MEGLVERLREAQALAKLVGDTQVFRESIRSLPVVAKSDATLLVTGETGTGKELVARAVHYLSPRAAFPFVPVNCGRLPDTLLEDELFGHERGAFTDAHAPRQGLIAQAEKGTLFLDEVEALSAKAQVVLLRVIEHKKYCAVGSSREQDADVRIIAATNAPLDQLVKAERFRADLYYRLYVFSIHLPPLRDRKQDILPLTYHFLKKHAPPERSGLVISHSCAQALTSYDWPGNVRELENAIIRSIHLCGTNSIVSEDLGIPYNPKTQLDSPAVNVPELNSLKEMKRQMIEAFEKEYLDRLMYEHRGNVSHAALAAGKERRELGKLLKKYRIDPRLFQESNPKSSGNSNGTAG